MSALRVPPGRAGRLRLARRLAAAEHGTDLLDRKLHALRAEQDRRRAAARESTAAWRAAAAEADLWLERAQRAGGRDAVRQALPGAPARVVLGEAAATGVRFPVMEECALPERGGVAAAVDGAALVCACEAYEAAVPAAVRAAADEAASRIVDEAVATTRRQVRALRRHWVPRLREALARVDAALEQGDQEDGVRRHRAAETGRSPLEAEGGGGDAGSERRRAP